MWPERLVDNGPEPVSAANRTALSSAGCTCMRNTARPTRFGVSPSASVLRNAACKCGIEWTL